jgi:TRAP-type C4-dicarboxylate transport system permease small subunit
MPKLITQFCCVIEKILALLLAAMVVIVFSNVVMRYGFNSGISMTEELSRWLFVWLVFLGAIVAIKERGHLGTDMLVSRLPVMGKKTCLLLSHLLMLYLTWLFLTGSLEQMRINWDVDAPSIGIPVSFFYGAGFVYSIFAGLLLLYDLLLMLTGKMQDDELVMVQESEEQAELKALQDKFAREVNEPRDISVTPAAQKTV